MYSFWYYTRVSLPAGVMAESELSSYVAMTAAGNDKREYNTRSCTYS
jgi:hypothetical protein